tara:strand:- start:4551 stop:5144 length:594 start_codon:yes stop_codon:yes gene_type:complete
MSESEVSGSDVYLKKNINLESGKNYLFKANSGSGKSSILNFIYQSNENFEGSIQYKNIRYENKIDIRKNFISYVFQDFKLFGNLSVWDNIKIKNNLTVHKTDKEINDLLNKIGLSEKKDSLVNKLSIGQRQRTAIVRSLCQPFKFLLLDEPFSNLDEDNITIITKILNNELENKAAGLIVTTLNNKYLFSYNKIFKL